MIPIGKRRIMQVYFSLKRQLWRDEENKKMKEILGWKGRWEKLGEIKKIDGKNIKKYLKKPTKGN